jgi:hypothetical protein
MSEDNLPWALAQAYDKLVMYGEKPEKRYMKMIRAAAQSFYGFRSLRERCEQLTERNNKLISTIVSIQKELDELDFNLHLKNIQSRSD